MVFGTIFPSTPAPTIQQPVAAPDYQAYDVVSAPLDVFPYGDLGYAV